MQYEVTVTNDINARTIKCKSQDNSVGSLVKALRKTSIGFIIANHAQQIHIVENMLKSGAYWHQGLTYKIKEI